MLKCPDRNRVKASKQKDVKKIKLTHLHVFTEFLKDLSGIVTWRLGLENMYQDLIFYLT